MLHRTKYSVVIILLIFAILAAGCTPAPAATPAPTALPPTATPEPLKALRYAIPAGLSTTNPWAIFGSTGTVWDAVQMGSLFPSLFVADRANQSVIPYAAKEYSEDFTQEGSDWTIQVPLTAGLKWNDGTAITANDVVYTITTAMKSGMGMGFSAAFNSNLLKSVAAADGMTVKFTFSRQPDTAAWQRILTAPFFSKAYWEPKTTSVLAQDNTDAIKKLQDQITEDEQSIQEKQSGIADQQAEVDRLNKEQISVKVGIQYIQAALDAKKAKDAEWVVVQTRQLNELIKLNSVYNNIIGEKTGTLQSAQSEIYVLTQDIVSANQSIAALNSQGAAAIYLLPADGQPTFSAWQAQNLTAGSGVSLTYQPDDTWQAAGLSAVNAKVYDSVQFSASDASQVSGALTGNQMDAALLPGSLAQTIDGAQMGQSGLSSHVYLQFSGTQSIFSLPAVRKAVACMLDDTKIAGDGVTPASKAAGFGNIQPCPGMDDATRLDTAAKMLRSAGFSWGSDSQGLAGTTQTLTNTSLAPVVSTIVPESATQTPAVIEQTPAGAVQTPATATQTTASAAAPTPASIKPVQYIGIIGPDQNVVLPLTLVYPAGADRAAVAQYISAQMAKLGFGVQLKELSMTDYLATLASGKDDDMVLNAWAGETGDEAAGWCAALGSGSQSAFGGIMDAQYSDSCTLATDLNAVTKEMASELTIIPLAQSDIVVYTVKNENLPDLTQTNSGLIGSANTLWWGFGVQ
jgi:ABC-type transport system substrate-binding protein